MVSTPSNLPRRVFLLGALVAGIMPLANVLASTASAATSRATHGYLAPVEAYDDRQDIFVTSDPYLGPNYRIGYNNFAQLWALRGYSFFILYPASRQAALSAAMAAGGWNKAAAYTHDLALL